MKVIQLCLCETDDLQLGYQVSIRDDQNPVSGHTSNLQLPSRLMRSKFGEFPEANDKNLRCSILLGQNYNTFAIVLGQLSADPNPSGLTLYQFLCSDS